MMMADSHLSPEVHETWHFILNPLRHISPSVELKWKGSHLCDLDFLATKCGKRDVCIIVINIDQRPLGRITMLPATLKTIVNVEEEDESMCLK